MRPHIMMGLFAVTGLLAFLALGGCSGGEVAERPADEPVRSEADVKQTLTEEEMRAAEEASQNPN